jgi:hypothetical protein
MRYPSRDLLGVLALSCALAPTLGCRNDPVPQQIIDALPEEADAPSAMHRPGEPCLACHSDYEGAQPKLAAGGTVYALNDAGVGVPAPGVLVVLNDSAGDSRSACTNAAGNFLIKSEDWAEVAFPLRASAGTRQMRSLIGRDGSCATCHKSSGPGRDSAGVILVEVEGPDPLCGGAP